jgi:hypothetical protein
LNWIKNAWKDIKAEPKTIREFGFLLCGFLLLLPLIANGLGILFAGKKFHYWLGWPALSMAAFILNLAAPSIVCKIYRAMMLLTHPISWVVMKVVLGILFYLVLAPISITMRLMGKDLLDEKLKSNQTSYWKPHETRTGKERYERLF